MLHFHQFDKNYRVFLKWIKNLLFTFVKEKIYGWELLALICQKTKRYF